MKTQITSHLDGKTHAADFAEVRRSNRLRLGWATVHTDDCTLRFPAILLQSATAAGYTVYTVSDWQAPQSTFGDLSDPVDWAVLCHTGSGKFVNPHLKDARPINVSALDLEMTAEQRAEFDHWKSAT